MDHRERLLQHERAMIATIGGRFGTTVAPVEEIAKRYVGSTNRGIADPILRDRIAAQKMDAHSFSLTTRRAREEAEAGMAAGAASSMFKYYGTELNKRRFELLVEAMGSQGLGWDGEGFEEQEITTTRGWLRSKANSIEGGTSEIQLNVIAKRVLGLPD